MGNVPLEKSLIRDECRWIPNDLFGGGCDVIPLVGFGFSVYRFTKETCCSLVDMFTKINGSVSDVKYLTRPFIRGIDMLGVAFYNTGLLSFFANN